MHVTHAIDISLILLRASTSAFCALEKILQDCNILFFVRVCAGTRLRIRVLRLDVCVHVCMRAARARAYVCMWVRV